MANNDLPTLICPSLLSCDLARIAEDANNMLELGADWLVRYVGYISLPSSPCCC